jgi:hypothetical protein
VDRGLGFEISGMRCKPVKPNNDVMRVNLGATKQGRQGSGVDDFRGKE